MTLRIAVLVFVAVLAVIGAFAFFIPHANQGGEVAPAPSAETPPVPPVTFTNSYKKGVHTVKGTVEAPTPCTLLTAHATVASGTPATISVKLLMPPDTGICLQQVTDLSFSVIGEAPANARIEVFLNDELATVTQKAL